MTDLQLAKNNLFGRTICLCKDGCCLFSEKRGISPMMDFIADSIDLRGYSAADLVVGKAVAMLFVKCGIVSVYAQTLSVAAQQVLERHGIPFEYQTLTDKIINRAGNDICPMEKTVSSTDDVEQAYLLLKNKLQSMQQ